MKRTSLLLTALVLLVSSALFVAASPAPAPILADGYVQVVGVVMYNDFGNHYSPWDGHTYGGTVYLKRNGVTIGSCAIGNGGAYSITSNLRDTQDFDLVVTTSVLTDGSDTWQGSTSYYHVQEEMEDVTIFAGFM